MFSFVLLTLNYTHTGRTNQHDELQLRKDAGATRLSREARKQKAEGLSTETDLPGWTPGREDREHEARTRASRRGAAGARGEPQ